MNAACRRYENQALLIPRRSRGPEELELFFKLGTRWCCGPGSSVGIATDYGLDGSGSNPGRDEIFRPSRPALGPTQPPVKWVPGLSWGKVRSERAADHSPPSSAAVMEQ